MWQHPAVDPRCIRALRVRREHGAARDDALDREGAFEVVLVGLPAQGIHGRLRAERMLLLKKVCHVSTGESLTLA